MSKKPLASAVKHHISKPKSSKTVKNKPENKPDNKPDTKLAAEKFNKTPEETKEPVNVPGNDENVKIHEETPAITRVKSPAVTRVQMAADINDMYSESTYNGTMDMLEWVDFHRFVSYLSSELPLKYAGEIASWNEYLEIRAYAKLIVNTPVFNSKQVIGLLQSLAGFVKHIERFMTKNESVHSLDYLCGVAKSIHRVLLHRVTHDDEDNAKLIPDNSVYPCLTSETEIQRESRDKLNKNVMKDIDMLNRDRTVAEQVELDLDIQRAAHIRRQMDKVNTDTVAPISNEYYSNPDEQAGFAEMYNNNSTQPERSTLMYSDTPDPTSLVDGNPIDVEAQLKLQHTSTLDNTSATQNQSTEIPVQIGSQPVNHVFARNNIAARVHTLKADTDFEDIPTFVYDLMLHTSHKEYTMGIGEHFTFINRSSEQNAECIVTILLKDEYYAMRIEYYRQPSKKYPMGVRVNGSFSIDDLNSHINARKLYNMLVDELNHC